MITTQRGLLKLCLFLFAATVPIYAQFVPAGCPQGFAGPHLSGFTAGNQSSSQMCLIGNFSPSTNYNVQLNSPTSQFTVLGIQASSSGLIFSVPPSFYATIANANGPDPVTVSVSGNGAGTGGQSFFTNPPLKARGPVFVGAVNAPISAILFQGGTGSFSTQISGQGPPGLNPFQASDNTWSGTPTQTGIFNFSILTTDAWGAGLSANLAFYIVPTPVIATTSPFNAGAGSPAVSVTVNGSGFVSPITVNGVAEPGTVVKWTPSLGSPTTLTPTSIAANQLTVTVPSSLLTSTGFFSLLAVNPAGNSASGGSTFTVYPTVTSISPSQHTVGAPAFPLDVFGTGFVNGTGFLLSSEATLLPTTFIDSTHVRTTVPTQTATGTYNPLVLNPDQTLSNSSPVALNFTARPTLITINPTSINAGSPAFQLTVSGANYTQGMSIFFNSVGYPATVVNSGQIAAIIPAAAIAAPGFVPVWVAAPDGVISTATQQFTIVSTVPPLQISTLAPLTSGVVNTPFTLNFTATGGTAPYTFSLIAGAFPAGLRMDATGLLTGTPTAIGTSRFTIQVADTVTSVSRDYSLTIAASPLLLTTPPLSNVSQNTPINIQFAGSGGVAPYSFVEFGPLPPGTSFTPAGVFSGTPTTPGTYSFLVFINDAAGSAASKTYSITVAAPGLLITPPSPLPSGQLNVPYTTQLAATGGAGVPYNWSATGLPSGLTIANNNGLIAGIPRESGTFTIPVTISDFTGATVTQNYTLVIASSRLSITTISLSSGAVGSSYSAGLASSGGTAPVTFTATGLPPGVTLAGTTLSGTPTTAGSFTVAVTATDAQGLTATANFPVIIASKLVVTGATISNAVFGTPITPVKVTATGGTPPYQWQSPNPAPGLNVALDGTVSGTPTAQGTFSFTVFAVDNTGALGSGTVQVTVGLPGAPAVTIGGLPATNNPATQPAVQVALANPYPASIIAKLTLTFVPDKGADDPAIQFASGGRTAQIVVPAGSTGGLTSVALSTGTVSGTITVTAQLLAGTQDVTPSPAPTKAVKVNPTVPVITAVTATRGSGGFTVNVTGYSSPRDLSTATYTFTGSALATLQTSQLATTVGTLFTTWYGSSASSPFGSQFTLSQPFTVTGDTSTIISVTVTLTNSIGTSQSFTANLQ